MFRRILNKRWRLILPRRELEKKHLPTERQILNLRILVLRNRRSGRRINRMLLLARVNNVLCNIASWFDCLKTTLGWSYISLSLLRAAG